MTLMWIYHKEVAADSVNQDFAQVLNVDTVVKKIKVQLLLANVATLNVPVGANKVKNVHVDRIVNALVGVKKERNAPVVSLKIQMTGKCVLNVELMVAHVAVLQDIAHVELQKKNQLRVKMDKFALNVVDMAVLVAVLQVTAHVEVLKTNYLKKKMILFVHTVELMVALVDVLPDNAHVEHQKEN